MLAGALSYPFVLIAKRPFTVLACLLVSVAIAGAVDVAVGRAGLIPQQGNPVLYGASVVVYYVARYALSVVPDALILLAALKDLAVVPPERRASSGDFVRIGLVQGIYTIAVIAPVQFIAFALRPWSSTYELGAFVLGVALFAVQSLLLMRLSFAWPHTITERRIVFAQAWSMSRRRFWTIAGVLVPVLLIGYAISYGGRYLAWEAANALPFPEGEAPVSGGFNQGWIVYLFFVNAVRTLGSYLLASSNVYLYARIMHATPERVAHVFA